jgi:hypothetical protein
MLVVILTEETSVEDPSTGQNSLPVIIGSSIDNMKFTKISVKTSIVKGPIDDITHLQLPIFCTLSIIWYSERNTVWCVRSALLTGGGGGYLTKLSTAMIIQYQWSIGIMIMIGENQSTCRKTCLSATFFATNPTSTNQGLNLGLCADRPATV